MSAAPGKPGAAFAFWVLKSRENRIYCSVGKLTTSPYGYDYLWPAIHHFSDRLPDVLQFCRAELLQENYFHAVFEATKSVADKIREKSTLTTDGARLVDEAFGFGAGNRPILAFNSLRTETEISEHRGLMNLIKRLFGTFRSTTAHAPKIKWMIREQDAFDMLTFTFLLHRRLDEAVRTAS